MIRKTVLGSLLLIVGAASAEDVRIRIEGTAISLRLPAGWKQQGGYTRGTMVGRRFAAPDGRTTLDITVGPASAPGPYLAASLPVTIGGLPGRQLERVQVQNDTLETSVAGKAGCYFIRASGPRGSLAQLKAITASLQEAAAKNL